MAAMVETMMYVGETPWHKLGTYVGDKEVNSDDALRLAGLDWEVACAPTYTYDAGKNEFVEIPNNKAIKRKDNGLVLSTMSDSYKPVQNHGKFKFFDEVVGGKHAMYHTAMSLEDGRKVVLTAKLPGTIKVKGDSQIDKYLALCDSFDGSLAFTMLLTPVRIVCRNTLDMALAEGGKTAFKLRHSVNIDTRVKDAQAALGFAVKQYDFFEEAANHLAGSKFTDKMMDKLAQTLFPANGEGQISPQAATSRIKVVQLFENGAGHEGIRGTAWAAVNAVAEFADHSKQSRSVGGRSEEEARAKSILFGAAAAMKQKAVNEVYNLLAA